MAVIVKANSSLTAGGLAVLKRSFTTSSTGVMTYTANYVCLAEYASRWTEQFRSDSQPPTPLPDNVLRLELTRTPRLVDLQTETVNGLTYFNATYSAGVNTDLVITESSEQRTLSWVSGYNATGQAQTSSFDYISHSVSVSGINTEIPNVAGRTGMVFNARNCDANQIMQGKDGRVSRQTIVTTSRQRNRAGEYTNTVTSSGIYTAVDATAPSTTYVAPQSSFNQGELPSTIFPIGSKYKQWFDFYNITVPQQFR